MQDAFGATPEVYMDLSNNVRIRKDAVMPDENLIIIKPDSPSGHKAAERRKELLNKNGYYDIIELFYNPKDPKYQPGSPTYIGPKNK